MEWQHALYLAIILIEGVVFSWVAVYFNRRLRQLRDGQDVKVQKIKDEHVEQLERLHEQHALQMRRRKEFFLLGVAEIGHGLNNLLTPILAFTDMGKEAVSERTWKSLAEQVDNLCTVLKSLLEGSRAILATNRDVQVRNLKHMLEEMFQRLHVAYQYEASFVIHDRVQRPVSMDFSRLMFIVRNLMSNSFKYAHPERALVLEVTIERRGEQVRLVFSDNGIGIPADKLEQVMQGFHRVREANVDGFGFGWFLITELVQSMQGTVQLRSEHGEWTEVELTFPLV